MRKNRKWTKKPWKINISLYKKIKKTSREHQRTVKSKKIASIEATEALGSLELDFDEYELEDVTVGLIVMLK